MNRNIEYIILSDDKNKSQGTILHVWRFLVIISNKINNMIKKMSSNNSNYDSVFYLHYDNHIIKE